MIDLRRTFDATVLNEVANDPDIRHWLGGEGQLDLTALVGDPANYAFACEHGGFILQCQEPGVYEVHSLVRKAGRGANLHRAIKDVVTWVFTATDCVLLQTKAPDGNRAAAGLAMMFGFREQFRREAAWPGASGLVGVSYQTLSLETWRERNGGLEALGHEFHEQLEMAKHSVGSPLPTHADDPTHDRAVGATVLMVKAGNARKGVWQYNRWARLAGYAPISLLSECPAVLDVVDAVVQARNGEMEVLLCR